MYILGVRGFIVWDLDLSNSSSCQTNTVHVSVFDQILSEASFSFAAPTTLCSSTSLLLAVLLFFLVLLCSFQADKNHLK